VEVFEVIEEAMDWLKFIHCVLYIQYILHNAKS
jgi:hypothetical protein